MHKQAIRAQKQLQLMVFQKLVFIQWRFNIRAKRTILATKYVCSFAPLSSNAAGYDASNEKEVSKQTVRSDYVRVACTRQRTKPPNYRNNIPVLPAG